MTRVMPAAPVPRLLPPARAYVVSTFFDHQPSYGVGYHVGIASAINEMRRRIEGGHVRCFVLQERAS